MYTLSNKGDNSAEFDQMWKSVETQLLTDSSLQGKVKLRYLPMPLPYHITAHKLVQALYYVKEKKGDEAALGDLRYFLQHLPDFSEAGCMNMTPDEIINKIANYVSESHG